MKKILFPTDFSNASANAFIYAIQLAKKINAEIITLHVYDNPVVSANEYQMDLIDLFDIAEWGDFENYKSKIPIFRTIAEKNHGRNIILSHVMERGEVVNTILEVAERDSVDFIVMGTSGAGAVKEFLFGSVTEKVMERSKTMVLAIPANCQFIRFSKILFLTRYEDSHLEALHKLVKFASLFAAHVDVLKVSEKYSERDEETKNLWKRTFAKDNVDFMILTSMDVEDLIMDVIELHRINLTAVTVKRKGLFEKLFLRSIASKLAFHSTVPLLSLGE